MVSDKPTRGGKRPGSGQKPRYGAPKVKTSIAVSVEVKAFLDSTGNQSEAIERTIRRSKDFGEWKKEQWLKK